MNCNVDITMKDNNIMLLEILYCSVMLCVRQCLVSPIQHNPGVDTSYVCMYYMFWPIATLPPKKH
jgi:hypothetical protein